ncbi:MAG: AraC family transcriptional regulator [Planctomycetota bacterium]
MARDSTSANSRLFQVVNDPASLLPLFDFLPHVYFYAKDSNGRFVAVNEALAQLRGVANRQELLGKTDLQVHPTYWGQRYQQEDREVLERGLAVRHRPWLVPDSSGHLRTFLSSKIPLYGKVGRPVGIAGVMYRLGDDQLPQRPQSALQPAIELIERRFGEPITVQTLARAVGLSASQLNRRFQSAFESTPSQYLQQVRIQQATRLLAESDDSVADIAQATGFYDQAHLTRTFRKWMQMTPTQFRNLE